MEGGTREVESSGVKPRVPITMKNSKTLPHHCLLFGDTSQGPLGESKRPSSALIHLHIFERSRLSSWRCTLWTPQMKMTAPHSATFSPPLFLHYERLTFGA